MQMQLKIIIPKPFTDAQGNCHETMIETAENIYFPLDNADFIIGIPLPMEDSITIRFIENNSIIRGFKLSAEIESEPFASMIDALLEN